MARQQSVTVLLAVGLVFHLVYIGTVFDCYFTSPVVNGMQSYGLDFAPAKRLVLIVGDGLRADLLLNVNPFPNIPHAPEVVAPYLRSIVETRGAFGISHTRVPTESRPGHVALIGGMYEDVSAVTKGWKANPVDFDSVFNRSRATFSFGSPDILPIFTHAAATPHVRTFMYDEAAEDFTKDAVALDVWVLDRLRALLHSAGADAALDAELRGERTVFFLHLLGLDTTGHSYRPHSEEYMKNIIAVDAIVRQAEALFAEFYNDAETAFVFTADHGMSRIGNHGDGDPDNTRTPLIAWGKGVRGPLPDSTPTSHDEYSRPFELGGVLRRDVSQADVAPLMAALVGLDFPVNSVGVLPDVGWGKEGGYLDVSEKRRAQAALVNAKVILEQYRRKDALKREHTLLYTPYRALAPPTTGALPGADELRVIEGLLAHGRWDDARAASARLIDRSLEGLHYLQTYDRTLIRGLVIAAYLGWIAYSASLVLAPPSSASLSGANGYGVTGLAGGLLCAFWALCAVQRAPWTFYVYSVFPCFFWRQALVAFRGWKGVGTGVGAGGAGRYVVFGVAAVAALQSMVAAYTHRSIWSAGFLILGLLWPACAWPREAWTQRPRLCAAWIASCLATAVFPLLSVNKEENALLVSLGGGAVLAAGLGALCVLDRKVVEGGIRVFGQQMLLVGVTMAVTGSSIVSLQAKRGLPLLNQVAGWTIIGLAALVPVTMGRGITDARARILMYFLAFGPLFVLLSISVEGLFYVAFSVTLALWIEVEAMVRTAADQETSGEVRTADQDTGGEKAAALGRYRPRLDDVRIALFFLFFVQVAFFGTGNVASISSFYLAPVYRLVPIFNPFLMASLLIYKIIAPYVILATVFAALNARLRLPPFSLFLVALSLTDVMTITFFFRVTDTGSWLEIGQTITFFCISSMLLVWSAGICVGGEYLMSNSSTRPRGIKED